MHFHHTVIILLKQATMSDDLETGEDAVNCPRAEVTDDSCTVNFIEIIPLERPSDGNELPEVIYPLFEIQPEDLQEIKQDLAEEQDNVDSRDPIATVRVPEFDDHTMEVINPIAVIPPEDWQEIKQDLAEEQDNVDSRDPMATVRVPEFDYRAMEVISPIAVIPPEDLQDLTQEPGDESNYGLPQYYLNQELAEIEYKAENPHFTTQVI